MLTLPKHCGLLQFNDVFLDESALYAVTADVMNYGNILNFLKKQRVPCLTEMEVGCGFLVITHALRALHLAGHVHGRVHPGSILVYRGDQGECIIKLYGTHHIAQESVLDVR